MIYYLLLLCSPVVGCLQSVAQKQYTLKYEKPNVILFSAVTSVIALCFFVMTSGLKLEFTAALAPYSLGFAAAYSAAWVGTVLALRYGPMAISTLIVSFSLVFPTVCGILMGEAVTPTVVGGLALLCAALVLVNLQKGQDARFSVKWLACVAVAFAGNGVCAIMQILQKRALGDSYAHEFMIIALAAASVMLFVCAAVGSRNLRRDFRECLPYSAMNGVANALVNLMTLMIIGHIPNTVFYPTNAALGMIASFLLAYFAYKERFSVVRYVGYALGVASVVLLNL